jgi:hypothetical protein
MKYNLVNLMTVKNGSQILQKSMSAAKALKSIGFEFGKQKEASVSKKEFMLHRAIF